MTGGVATRTSTMLNFSRDICDLLESRASSGRDAFAIVETTFAKIIAVLRRDPRFTNIPVFELELLLADSRGETETTLFAALRDRIHLDDAEDAVHRTLGEPAGEPL
jgi:hypothetical protein